MFKYVVVNIYYFLGFPLFMGLLGSVLGNRDNGPFLFLSGIFMGYQILGFFEKKNKS